MHDRRRKAVFLKVAVGEFCPRPNVDEDDSDYRTVVVLFAAMLEGTNISRLTELTCYPKEFIVAISLNMRKAGLWVEDGVCYEHWFEGDLIKRVDVCCDLMVAKGQLIVTRRDGGKIWYKAVRPS